MAEVTFKLDDAALREATAQAMVGVLTPETRAKILESAIQSLLAPVKTGYGYGQREMSPIQAAFENAVRDLAFAEARRMVNEDPTLKERMTALLRASADKLLASDQHKMANSIADAFARALKAEGRE